MSKKLVGITGCPGCGKSVVAKLLTEKGAALIDVDQAGRWALEQHTQIRSKIRSVFGNKVFHSDNTINRKKLGTVVFADPAQLLILNRIVHPKMLERVYLLIKKERKSIGDAPYIVVDAALLYELKLDKSLDIIVTVDAPLEKCVERLIKRDELSKKEIEQRISAQLPQEEKVEKADIVVYNEGTIDELQIKTNQLHHIIKGI